MLVGSCRLIELVGNFFNWPTKALVRLVKLVKLVKFTVRTVPPGGDLLRGSA